MGGDGSGRSKTRERDLIEDCDCLDINEIAKDGFTIHPAIAFIENNDGKQCVFVKCSFDGINCVNHKSRIALTKTYPYFGGERYWFICPQCGKRVGKLFRHESKSEYKCRLCHNLMYSSQESNVYDSWLKKMSKISGLTPKQFERSYLMHHRI